MQQTRSEEKLRPCHQNKKKLLQEGLWLVLNEVAPDRIRESSHEKYGGDKVLVGFLRDMTIYSILGAVLQL